jgi:hypothetical protein
MRPAKVPTAVGNYLAALPPGHATDHHGASPASSTAPLDLGRAACPQAWPCPATTLRPPTQTCGSAFSARALGHATHPPVRPDASLASRQYFLSALPFPWPSLLSRAQNRPSRISSKRSPKVLFTLPPARWADLHGNNVGVPLWPPRPHAGQVLRARRPRTRPPLLAPRRAGRRSAAYSTSPITFARAPGNFAAPRQNPPRASSAARHAQGSAPVVRTRRL